MPNLVQIFFILVAATIIAKIAIFILSILRPTTAAAKVAHVARASKAGMQRIVMEAQELLVPIDGVPPTAGRGGMPAVIPSLVKHHIPEPRRTKP